MAFNIMFHLSWSILERFLPRVLFAKIVMDAYESSGLSSAATCKLIYDSRNSPLTIWNALLHEYWLFPENVTT